MKLGVKIGAGFGLVLILLIAISLIGIRELESITAGYSIDMMGQVEVEKQAAGIPKDILQVRRSEKDFIARKDLKYVTRVGKYLDLANGRAEELERTTTNEQVRARVGELKSEIAAYRQGFAQLVQAVEAYGLTETEGAQGASRQAAHKFEQFILDPAYQVTDGRFLYLMLRRHEKDYMLRGTTKYLERSDATLEQIFSNIVSSSLGRTRKEELTQLLDTYRTHFKTLVGKGDEIKVHLAAIKKSADRTMELAEEMATLEDAQMAAGMNRINASESRSITLLWIAGALSVVVGLLAAFFLTRMITRPLTKVVGAAQTIARGDLNQELDIRQRDEIGQLADAFREMGEALRVKADAAEQIAKGNLSLELEAASQEDTLGHAMINMVDSLKKMNSEIAGLVDAAVAGELDTRGDVDQFQGDYAAIIQGVNNTLDAVIEPINEAADVLDKMANRDLTARVVGDYQGDHARIKDSLNTAVQNLDEGLVQVGSASDQVTSAAGQISGGSQALAQGASEQASSLEEISSSLEEMASMTRQNAENSNQAKSLAQTARESADNGTGAMERMTQSINSIKGSSDETAKIVKTIDEIAFQTNLLALNAAVEAARAGEAGKGFAVVAEEVRNLAQRSAEAAKNTADLIEESVNNADEGVKVTEEVAQILGEIAEGSRKVNDLVGEIAAASNEQSQGIEQVNSGVTQMNQVTQQNAANAEESASAAEELNGQASELQGLVGQFTLSKSGRSQKKQTVGGNAQSAPQPPPQIHSLLQEKENRQGSTTTNGDGQDTSGTPPKLLIPLGNKDEGVLNEF